MLRTATFQACMTCSTARRITLPLFQRNFTSQTDIKSSLALPSIAIDSVPKLTNFEAAKEFFGKKVVEGNHEIDNIWAAPEHVQNAFRTIFPEIVESRGITKLKQDTFQLWDNQNEILVELDDDSIKADFTTELLSVGGPSALTSAFLYKLRNPKAKVTYGVTNRQDSNHDGSAYYFHERDAFPVGPYCVYADLRKRFMNKEKLLKECIQNRHHVKISLNWKNIKPTMVFGIFVPNFYHMMNDIYIKDPKKTLMRHTVEHAKKTHDIVDAIVKHTGLPRESMLFQGKQKACYVGFSGGTNPKDHFTWLNSYTDIPFEVINHEEAFGKQVNQVVAFPRDGLMSPWIFDNLKSELQKRDGQVSHDMQVVKILVKKITKKPKVTKVVWIDQSTGKTHVTAVEKFFFSFGPSATLKANPPKYSLFKHFKDILSGEQKAVYEPTWASLARHVVNRVKDPIFRGTQVFKEFMWAAGSSSVMMVGVDINKASPAKLGNEVNHEILILLELFTKFMDGVNQHWTLIAQRDVKVGENSFRYFAIQMTGGGNFPSRKITPDYLVNLLFTTEKMMGLNEDESILHYDVVQSRGCGRGVSAKNSVAFSPIAENAVGSYALGGIGMTTMFPNGELIIQLLENGQGVGVGDLQNGKIGNQKVIIDFYGKNVLQGVDYTTLVDDDRKLARMFGWDNSIGFSRKPSQSTYVGVSDERVPVNV